MNVINKALITRSTIGRIIRCNAHAGRASWIQESRPQALAAAMLRDEDFQPVQVPFDGFYNSFLTAAFDEGIAHELEWQLEEADSGDFPLTRDELEECARDCVISSADAVEIARAWVDRYEDYLSDAANDLADENAQQDQICLRFASYNAEANAAGYWLWGDEEPRLPISLKQICGGCASSQLRRRPAIARTFAKRLISQDTSASASRRQAAGFRFIRRTFTSGVRSQRGMRRRWACFSISFALIGV